MSNAISWFELPANDYDRAVKFYADVIGEDLIPIDMPGVQMAFFPTKENGVGGAVVKAEGHTPSTEGSLVYLNGGEDLNLPLGRIEKAGGKVVLPKTDIGEHGFIARFMDTEGNQVAFHSLN